ncbi:MAG: 3-methylitaconate isomerase [Lachnospiraceae bacterium]|nr:3-methylitaconate isomerase [Lachnospiraceae bacterium]
MRAFKTVYMRGGTSKALFFHRKDLPEDSSQWAKLFMKVMGTPDPKQIDGMGGTYPVTSKVAVIAPSEREGIDVDYTFYQIGIDVPVVESQANCGNISSAVGPFAVDEGLVTVTEPVTVVRIWNTNTGKVIEEHVRVKDKKAMTSGSQSIPGVPGTGAPIDMYFEQPGGAVTGRMFPSGHKQDVLQAPGYDPVTVTMIDCSNPVVFIRAMDLGIQGTELSELGENKKVMAHVEAIRREAAVFFGFAPETLSVPKVSVISPPQEYVSSEGRIATEQEMDLCARVITVGKFHKTHPITVGVATAAAACIPGTIVQELAVGAGRENKVRIGQPGGILDIRVVMDGENVLKGGAVRTARRIMDGYVYVEDD